MCSRDGEHYPGITTCVGFMIILGISAMSLNFLSFTSSVKGAMMITPYPIFHTCMIFIQIKCCKDCVLLWKWDHLSKAAVPKGPFSSLCLSLGCNSLIAHELDDWEGFLGLLNWHTSLIQSPPKIWVEFAKVPRWMFLPGRIYDNFSKTKASNLYYILLMTQWTFGRKDKFPLVQTLLRRVLINLSDGLK